MPTRYFRARTLYKGTLLPDGTIGLTTISGGVVIMDVAGHALRYINQDTGLPNDNGLSMFVDHGGTLWVAPEGAVCQVEIPSPLSRFDIKVGLSGSVTDVVRHKGVLYVATGVGVFFLDTATSTFKQVTGFREGNSQATGLASNGDVLMVGLRVGPASDRRSGGARHQAEHRRLVFMRRNPILPPGSQTPLGRARRRLRHHAPRRPRPLGGRRSNSRRA